MNKAKYILIHEYSLHRAESPYKSAYGYEKVAQRHADALNDRALSERKEANKRGKAAAKKNGYKFVAREDKHDKIIVVTEDDYDRMIAGKGEWKHNLLNPKGEKIWVAFDTSSCSDPSSETYHSM